MKTKLLIILILLCGIANAQLTFQKTLGGGVLSEAYSIKQTNDGGYVVAGHTASFGAGADDVYLIKTDVNGAIVWTKTFGGINQDFGQSVQQTTDGGYVIAGIANANNVYLIKTDANGNILWTKTYGGNSFGDAGYSIQQTTDGGYVIAGTTQSFGAGSDDVYLIKTDASGNITWAKAFGGSNTDYGYSVQQTTDGGYVITGYTYSFGAGDADVYLIKTDGNGTIVWTKTYGGPSGDFGRSVQQTTDGGYVIAGSLGYDAFLIKTNTNGDTLWTKTYGGTSVDDGYSVQQTTDGGYIILGSTTSFGVGVVPDVYVIKTDVNGNVLWSRLFGGTGYDIGHSIQQTTDGGYFIGGYTQSFGNGSDVYLIKIASNGYSGCNENNPATITTNVSAVVTNPATLSSPGGLIINFTTQTSTGAVVSTLCTTVGINENYLTGNFVNIFPNPFSSQTVLQTDNPLHNATLTVDNCFGQTVAQIKNLRGQAITFNRDNLASGLYFIRLTEENKTIVIDKLVIADK